MKPSHLQEAPAGSSDVSVAGEKLSYLTFPGRNPSVIFSAEGNSLLQNLSSAIPAPLAESSTASLGAPCLCRAGSGDNQTRLAHETEGVLASRVAARWPEHLLRLLKHGFVSVTLPWALGWGSPSVNKPTPFLGGSTSSLACRAVSKALCSVLAGEAWTQQLEEAQVVMVEDKSTIPRV